MNSLPDAGSAVGQSAVAGSRQLPSISTHYLRYSASNALALLAAFISFPILTRLLDNTQFGILRYYESFMLIGVAVIKLGAPHAIVRHYPYDRDAARILAFDANHVVLPLLLSGVLWMVGAIGMGLWALERGHGFSPIVWCAVLITPMLAASAIIQSVMRASERSDVVMASRMIGRLLELGLVLGAVILVQQSALAVYGGKIIAVALLLAWLMHWLRRNIRFARRAVDFRTLRTGLIYGLPLMAHELTYSILSNVDRVLIKEITGDFAMAGIYSIGWSLAMQVNLFISATLSEAFTPVANRVYEIGGNKEVRALKERVLVPVTYAVVAIVAMVLVTGKDLIVALSGPAKAASGEVFVVLAITVSLDALVGISSFGLLLKKRTMVVLMITVGTTLLNIALNFLLIPRLGYMGAAWAAAISYAAMAVAEFACCPRGLVQMPGARPTALALVCGAVLVIVAQYTGLFGLQGAWPRLVVAGGLFAVLYALPVLALDPELRRGLAALRSNG